MNGLSQVDYSDYMPAPQQATNVTTEAMVSRQAQEVQAAMVIAKKFPRDVYAAFDRIKHVNEDCWPRTRCMNIREADQKYPVLLYVLLKRWRRTGGTLITGLWNWNRRQENRLSWLMPGTSKRIPVKPRFSRLSMNGKHAVLLQSLMIQGIFMKWLPIKAHAGCVHTWSNSGRYRRSCC